MQTLQNASGDFYDLPTRMFVRGFGAQVDTAQLELGTVLPTESRGVLEGIIRTTGREDALSDYDELLVFLQDAPIKVRNLSRTSRYLTVFPEGWDDTRTSISDRIEFRVALIAYDPFWHDPEETSDQSSSGGNWDFTLNNAGTLRVPLRFTLSDGSVSSGTAATFRNDTTDQELVYRGVVATDQELTVDGETREVTLVDGADTTGQLDLIDEEFLVSGLYLAPGDNDIQIRNVGGSGRSLTLRWQPSYLS